MARPPSMEEHRTIWHRLRLRLMVLVLLAEIALLLALLRRYPLGVLTLSASSAVFPPQPSRMVVQDDRRDPLIGASFPQIVGTIRLRVLGDASGYLVCFVRDCTSCIQTDLAALHREAIKYGVAVVVIMPATPNSETHLTGANGVIPVVVDGDGQLTTKFNAVWNGRTYLLSPQGRLLWVQRRWGPGYRPDRDAGLIKCLQELGGKQ